MKKIILYFTLSLIVILFVPVLIFAQGRPVKEDFIPQYEKVTPPPKSCKEAYSKINCNNPESSGCNADNIDKALSDRLEGIIVTLSGVPMQAGNYSDFKKKMEGLSDQQKKAMAMQMAKQYMQNNSMNSYQPESQKVIRAEEVLGKMNQTEAERISKSPFDANTMLNLKQKYQKKRDAVDIWYKEEYKKLPPDTEPKAVFEKDPNAKHELDIKEAQKYVDIENSYLNDFRNLWDKQKEVYKTDYSEFEDALAKVHYGDDVHNNSLRGLFAVGQKRLVAGILYLIGETQDAYKEAGEYYKELLDVEKR